MPPLNQHSVIGLGQLPQDARVILHSLRTGNEMALVEDHRWYAVNTFIEPAVFGSAHVFGKTLILQNGQGFGPCQSDLCRHIG